MDMLMQALVQGILIGSAYGIVALGLGLIYGVSNTINFAHGDFLSLGMYICFTLYTAFALDPYLSMAISMPILAVVGGIVFYVFIRPILNTHLLMIVQLTLGLTFILQNGLLMVFGGQPHKVPSFIDNDLLVTGGIIMRLPLLVSAGVCVALAVLLYAMLTYTDFGRSIRAVNQNPRAAALMGVNVTAVRVGVFALGFALLAIAGALLLPGLQIQPSMGLRYTVITLLTLVLGGMTNFIGILLGGLTIGVSEAIGTTFLSGVAGMILPYVIFIIIMLFRPAGLLGKN